MPIDNKFELQKVVTINNGHENNHNNNISSSSSATSSRWPKAEVHALIRLRTSMDHKYQENGPKGPLWEDISLGMQRLGYNRNAKRCKEKWENINKYFKKVKESNKQRREDSKTCPYFQELEALYKDKTTKINNNKTNNGTNSIIFGEGSTGDHDEMMMEPLMVQPEQQWRPPPHGEENNNVNDDMFRYEGKDIEEEGDDGDGDGDDNVGEEDEEDGMEEEEGNGGGYVVAVTNSSNKIASVDTVE